MTVLFDYSQINTNIDIWIDINVLPKIELGGEFHCKFDEFPVGTGYMTLAKQLTRRGLRIERKHRPEYLKVQSEFIITSK